MSEGRNQHSDHVVGASGRQEKDAISGARWWRWRAGSSTIGRPWPPSSELGASSSRPCSCCVGTSRGPGPGSQPPDATDKWPRTRSAVRGSYRQVSLQLLPNDDMACPIWNIISADPVVLHSGGDLSYPMSRRWRFTVWRATWSTAFPSGDVSRETHRPRHSWPFV